MPKSNQSDSETDATIADTPRGKSNRGLEKMTEYEKQRLKRIEENKARMKAMGLDKMASSFMDSVPISQNHKQKGKKKVGLEDDEEYEPSDVDEESSSSSGSDNEDEFCASRTKPKLKNSTPSKKISKLSGSMHFVDDDDDEDEALMKAIALSLQDSQGFLDVENRTPPKKTDVENKTPSQKSDVENKTPPQKSDLENRTPPKISDVENKTPSKKSDVENKTPPKISDVENKTPLKKSDVENKTPPQKSDSNASNVKFFETKESEHKDDSRKRKRKNLGKQFTSRVQMTEDELILHFFQFDETGKGGINLRDLERVAILHDFTWKDEEMEHMIHFFDSDQDGKLSLEDFTKIVERCNMKQSGEA